jgi:hypothetical protein
MIRARDQAPEQLSAIALPVELLGHRPVPTTPAKELGRATAGYRLGLETDM